MKLYKTEGLIELIEEVEATKVTEKTVWLSNGRRSAKRSDYTNYWDTIEEAKEHLEKKYKRMIKNAETKIEKVKADLETLSKY